MTRRPPVRPARPYRALVALLMVLVVLAFLNAYSVSAGWYCRP